DLVGDFDGDGQRDRGYFANGTWRLQIDNAAGDGQLQEIACRFGTARHIPLVGDWDGDGRDDLGTYDRKRSCILQGTEGATVVTFAPTGNFTRRVPLVGRWDGDNVDRPGLATYTDEIWQLQLQCEQSISQFRLRVPNEHGNF